MTLRDTSTALHALDLHYRGNTDPQLLRKILNYVSSHNTYLKKLEISVGGDSSLILSCVSSCRALRSLKLKVYSDGCGNHGKILFPKSLNFPALTNLDLYNFTFCANDNADCSEPFIAFTNLKSLTIVWCTVRDAPILSISSETLVNLTMFNNSSDFTKIQLSTPNLSAFSIFGTPYQKLCGTGLSSVKQVDIQVYSYFHFDGLPLTLLNWLHDLDNVKSLTVASSTLKVP